MTTIKNLIFSAVALFCFVFSNHAQSKIDLSLLKIKNKFVDLIEVDTTQPVRDPIIRAELFASSEARKILELGRKMALIDKTIIPGTCWTYVNSIFKLAGFLREDRQIIHRGKKKGPYADIDSIKPGDWLYYINHAYHGIDHSGIFIYWVDKAKKIGLILSYPGRYKRKPGRYREYDLNNVFFITRAAKEEEEEPKLEASKL
jgi:hypothetical protein